MWDILSKHRAPTKQFWFFPNLESLTFDSWVTWPKEVGARLKRNKLRVVFIYLNPMRLRLFGFFWVNMAWNYICRVKEHVTELYGGLPVQNQHWLIEDVTILLLTETYHWISDIACNQFADWMNIIANDACSIDEYIGNILDTNSCHTNLNQLHWMCKMHAIARMCPMHAIGCMCQRHAFDHRYLFLCMTESIWNVSNYFWFLLPD